MLLRILYWNFLQISVLFTDRGLVEIISLHRKWNKVIRPKSCASALSKKVFQTDRQTDSFFFQKDFWNGCLFLQVSSPLFRDVKTRKKPLKQFCDQPTDQPTDGPTEKWLIELRSTRLKIDISIGTQRVVRLRLSYVSISWSYLWYLWFL